MKKHPHLHPEFDEKFRHACDDPQNPGPFPHHKGRPGPLMRRFGRRIHMHKKLTLTVFLVAAVFLIMLISSAIIGIIAFLFSKLGWIAFDGSQGIWNPILFMLPTSIVLGTCIAAVMSRRTMKPFHNFVRATQKVAKGDFDVRIERSGIFEMDIIAHSFNKMVHELSGIETLRSDFVNNFSHEFKTPIVSIRGFAKLLKEGDLDEEEQQEYLDIIISESERLADLATNILNLSKIENIEILAEKELFSLDEQIRRVILLLEPRWSTKELSVSVDLDKIELFSNQNIVQQLWTNLLDNAIKNTDQGGSIAISLTKKDQEALFKIEDNGCGMDEETLAHIFDKFYQGEKSHSSAGNGVGLTLAKKIVELCEGSISVESSLGHGSVFRVTLPLHLPPAE